MAEKPTKHPTNQYASLEPARKRPQLDVDFQEAIKKAKREWQKDNAPLALTPDAAKSPSFTRIPGLGHLTRGDRTLKSENVVKHGGEPDDTSAQQRRNASDGRRTTDICAGSTSGPGRESGNSSSTPVSPLAKLFRSYC
jgi:hypothetical protein